MFRIYTHLFLLFIVIQLLPDFPSPVGQQPAVHAGGVEEVEAGESPHHVPRQEVRQADHAVGAGLLHTPALARGSDSDHGQMVTRYQVQILELSVLIDSQCERASHKLPKKASYL